MYTNPFAPTTEQMYGNTSARAVLFLFEPNRAHPLGVQAHRPMVYNFTDRFVQNAMDIASASTNSAGPTHMGVVEQMLRTPEGRQSVVAGEVDAQINLNHITDFWRFTVIINKPKAPEVQGAALFSNLVNHRVIISGYCSGDEPINRLTGTLNPNCMMVFTHKTVLESIDRITPDGMGMPHLTTRYDANIVTPGVPQLSTNPELYYIDPTNAYGSVYDSSGGQSVVSPGHQQRVGYNDQTKALSSKLQNPEHNLKFILGNVISARREVTDRPHLTHLYNESHSQLPGQNMETLSEVLTRNMSGIGNTAALMGPNENDVLTIGVFDQQYNPEVQVVEADHITQFGVMDQTLNTASNAFCSLIAAAAPALMSSSGIVKLDFKFASYYDNQDPTHSYGLDIYNAVPAAPMPTSMLSQRVNAVIGELHRTLFQTMYLSQGDFILHAGIDLGGLTHLYLHFVSNTQRYAEPYEHPTILSGMITPLIGNLSSMTTNASSIGGLVDSMTLSDQSWALHQHPMAHQPMPMQVPGFAPPPSPGQGNDVQQQTYQTDEFGNPFEI